MINFAAKDDRKITMVHTAVLAWQLLVSWTAMVSKFF